MLGDGMRPVARVIAALERCGKQVRAQGEAWIAQCPAHDDRHASLSIREGERGRPNEHKDTKDTKRTREETRSFAAERPISSLVVFVNLCALCVFVFIRYA
jgi:hypothetical protein